MFLRCPPAAVTRSSAYLAASHNGSPLKLLLLLLLSSPGIWVAIYTLHARLPRRLCWAMLPLVALLPVRALDGPG